MPLIQWYSETKKMIKTNQEIVKYLELMFG